MNVAAGPGVYALLLGSGVSRSAGIPTGWDVVLDLVRKLSEAAGADPELDAQEWYQSTYGEPPRYSSLLEEIAPTPAERRSLLKGHFEPTPEEREEGIKTPTDAHRAIAEMVAAGWIRVIVTTNFDQLIESALNDVGVAPVVISTPDQVEGAPPLALNDCTVIKVHGDYLDTRIRNSDEELAEYEPPMNALLDRVFDEYGLVVCGWSGDYDVALRDALDRSKSRRYTTYWCARGDLNAVTKPVAENRAAQLVTISDADTFFTELEERVTGIHKSGEQHPMETRAAVETLKRYLPEERHRIRLRELVKDATEELVSHLTVDEFPNSSDYTNEAVAERVRQIDALSERTLALAANGCFWGTAEQDEAWVGIIRRLAEFEVPSSGVTTWLELFRYPALVALYATGIASVAEGRYDLLASLLLMLIRSPNGREREPILQSMNPENIVPKPAAHLLYPHPHAPEQRYPVPRNQFLHLTLRSVFAKLIPADRDYTEAFDRFEYVASLVETDLDSRRPGGGYPEHRWFDPRARGFTFLRSRMAERMRKEIDQAGQQWPPLQAGLFGGSVERLLEAKGAVDKDNAG